MLWNKKCKQLFAFRNHFQIDFSSSAKVHEKTENILNCNGIKVKMHCLSTSTNDYCIFDEI